MKQLHLLRVTTLTAILPLCISACGSSSKVQLVSDDLKDLRGITAEHTAELGEIRDQLRIISGQIEELQFQSAGKTQELERSLARLGSRVPPPSGVPADLLEEDEQRIARIAGDSALTLSNGLAKLRVGAFEEAISDIRIFIQENPNTSLSDNAYFWLGITFENLGRYEDSIGAYSSIFQKFPGEDRAPISLLQLGRVFVKLGSKADAKLALQKLIDDYPQSSYVEPARAELKKL